MMVIIEINIINEEKERGTALKEKEMKAFLKLRSTCHCLYTLTLSLFRTQRRVTFITRAKNE